MQEDVVEKKPRATPQPMLRERIEITAEVVKRASALAAARSPQLAVWADTKVRYLIIRQKGVAAKWAVKAFNNMRVIGDIRERQPGYLSTRAARERAAEVYAELKAKAKRGGPEIPASADEKPPAEQPWTVSEVCLRYTAMMSKDRWLNERTKPPSSATVDDIRRAFSHDAVQVLGPMLVTDLNRPVVEAARDGIVAKREGSGVHRARRKFIVWFRAALSWAANKHPVKSGLVDGTDRWWERLGVDDPSDAEQKAIAARRALRLRRKSELDVDGIGAILARHEAYCAGRTGRDLVGPGVRFGLWWVNMTANRRYTTVKLERKNFLDQDPFGEPGWGRAMWKEDQMKAKTIFWLPLPTVVRDVALYSMQDWKQLVRNQSGDLDTAWVFASTRRDVRDHDDQDPSIYPNSLNRHLARMRTAGALDDLPYYSLHLARAAMTKFLEKHVSPRAASLTLAHALKDSADEEMAQTTRDYYSVTQHMEEKAVAMRAWTDALIEAFLKADGKMPAPSATIRKPKTNRSFSAAGVSKL